MREEALHIVKVLNDAGFSAYWVGGCVRDIVMGSAPADFDIATNATPEIVMKLFPVTVAVGAQFGVVLVVLHGVNYEVATFRSDVSYTDGRHPDAVRFSQTAQEDAARRDFTINGLFYDPLRKEVLDYVGGRADIERKLIRAIGRPRERFQEDKLRMLRAVRFAARFEYMVEEATLTAVRELKSLIHQVSAERIRDELTKMLTEGHAHRAFLLLDEIGLLSEVLPEIAAMKGVEQPPEFHPEGDVFTHTMLLLQHLDQTKLEGASSSLREVSRDEFRYSPRGFESYPPATLAWGALLHDVGKPPTFRVAPDRIRFDGHTELGATMARAIGHRLRMTNKEIDTVAELVADHLRFKDVRNMKESTLKKFVRAENFAEHLELHRLDCRASHGLLDHYHFTRDYALNLKPEDVRPQPLITGHDLIALGYKPGPVFKTILTAIEDAQLESSLKSKDEALRFVKENFPINQF